jgi:stress response protein YsnF
MAETQSPTAGNDPLRVPVVQERLEVGTRTVDTGRGVRIHKCVAENPVTIDERLLRDEVEVSHVPVDRIVAPEEAPAVRYEGETLVVPVLEEVLVVERRLRIKEELHITVSRREERHVETVMLKSEQVRVERFDEARDPPPTT